MRMRMRVSTSRTAGSARLPPGGRDRGRWRIGRGGEQLGGATLQLQQLARRDRVVARQDVDLDAELHVLRAVAQGARGELIARVPGGQAQRRPVVVFML